MALLKVHLLVCVCVGVRACVCTWTHIFTLSDKSFVDAAMACFAAPDGDKEAVAAATVDDNQNSRLAHSPSLSIYIYISAGRRPVDNYTWRCCLLTVIAISQQHNH